MSELVFRDDGRVITKSNFDPAMATLPIGWKHHVVGLDLGRNDPTAIVVVEDKCLPDGNDLGLRTRTVVFHETVQLYSYTDIADFLVKRLAQLHAPKLAIDASGLGQPFSSVLTQAGVEHYAVTMTAGASLKQEGTKVSVAKNLLIENMAVGLETGALTIADDLPQKQELVNEIASFEMKATSAGNLVLDGGGKGHHADRAVALALAYLSTTHLRKQRFAARKLTNWH